MLQPGDPATLHAFTQIAFIHVTHGDLAIRLVLGPQRSAKIGSGAGGGARGRVTAVVALELAEQVTGPGLSALVVDQVVHLERIVAALEGETLDVVDTIGAVFQIDDHLVLTFGQLVFAFLAAVLRTTARLVRAVADQAALCLVDTLAAALEQLERHIGTILPTRVLRQMQFDDVAAARIDGHIQHVAAHTNQLAARRVSRQSAGLLLAGNRGHVASGAFTVGGRAIRKSRCARLALRGFGR